MAKGFGIDAKCVVDELGQLLHRHLGLEDFCVVSLGALLGCLTECGKNKLGIGALKVTTQLRDEMG